MGRDAGKFVKIGSFDTHYHEYGSGPAVVMLHGSGPGVSAWENWSGNFDQMGVGRRVLAPDIVGFGETRYDPSSPVKPEMWGQHVLEFLDTLKIQKAVLIGNSLGSFLSYHIGVNHPERVAGIVLMGTSGGEIEVSPALAMLASYEPSLENMRRILLEFPADPALVTDEMVASRHAMSLKHYRPNHTRPPILEGAQKGAPRKIQTVPFSDFARIAAPTLIVHGREDRVLPPEIAFNVHRAIPNSRLAIYGGAGHWAQIERREWFNRDVCNFLDDINWGYA